MTRKEISILSLRIMSLYAFLKVIEKLPDVFYFFLNIKAYLEQEALLNLMLVFISPSLFALFGILLWIASPKIANIIFKSKVNEEKSDYPGSDYSLADIQTISFSVVGLVVLAIALPELIKTTVMYYTISTSPSENKLPLIGSLIVLLTQSIFGFWLLLKPRGLMNIVRSQLKKELGEKS